ncbi:MAG: radical SAM protein [Bacteroidetes bacterium]|nr:radical SAM protein [Bacteroidota bacterium]MBU1421821.1 radical SAM protein [Bacteroidota bacterium]MBU2636335.1 radical SAM protein [Bacteroidota bacterium]
MQTNNIQTKPDILIVNEIFYSIQGESTHAGRPCVFVRLTYCNLRCTYCDTAYAFEEGLEMTIDEIIEKVDSYKCNLVEITGGEPLVQVNAHKLTKALCDKGYEVVLETGGSLSISDIDPRVKRIVDFKCPSSGMEKKNFWENVNYLKNDDEVKFVIGDRNDYEWAKEKIGEYGLVDKCTLLMSPVFGAIDPKVLAGWILEDKLDVRFQIQIQKYIWQPDARGV